MNAGFGMNEWRKGGNSRLLMVQHGMSGNHGSVQGTFTVVE